MQVRVNQSVGMRDEHACTVLEEVGVWLPVERGCVGEWTCSCGGGDNSRVLVSPFVQAVQDKQCRCLPRLGNALHHTPWHRITAATRSTHV